MKDADLPVEQAHVVVCEACKGDSAAFRRHAEAVDEARLWAAASADGRCLCDRCRESPPTIGDRKPPRKKQ